MILVNSGLFQQLLTKLIFNKVKSEQFDKPLFLGGLHKENYAMWRCVLDLSLTWLVLQGCWRSNLFPCQPSNKDRILWKCCYFISWHIYICIRATPFLQFVSDQGNSRTFFPTHDLTNYLYLDLVENLPAIHALTWCDTASKVSTKRTAVRQETNCYQLLYAFGRLHCVMK